MNRTVWLWLLVIFMGIQFGAGWYEKLTIVPLWADASADQVLAAMESSGMKRAGRAFWPFVSPVVALLAAINLVVAWRSNTTYRRWWLAAGVAMTVYALASYGYFVPQILAFQSSGESWTAPDIETFVTWWTGLNYPRMTIGGTGWLCALPRPVVVGHCKLDQCAGGAICVVTCRAADVVNDRPYTASG